MYRVAAAVINRPTASTIQANGQFRRADFVVFNKVGVVDLVSFSVMVLLFQFTGIKPQDITSAESYPIWFRIKRIYCINKSSIFGL
jgi:hypothetical protein